MTDNTITELPRAHGPAPVTALMRQHAADFFVEEHLGFTPEGGGEHVFLFIEKANTNTQFVADRLAMLAGINKRHVAYSGMKDRHAVTRQWFSVHLPGNKNIDWTSLNNDHVRILETARHKKKLRRGVHKENFFRITLKDLSGDIDGLSARLHSISQQGVPNYFGEQRFGHSGANLSNARQWFAGQYTPKRHQRSIYLSAARAFIFNQVLAARVCDRTWNTAKRGEWLMLNGSHSVFLADDNDFSDRLLSGDVHTTGPLVGSVDQVQTDCGSTWSLEQGVFEQHSELISGLAKSGLTHQRRALRVIPRQFCWQLSDSDLTLSFFLPRGCFATAVVRELADYSSQSYGCHSRR